MSNPTSIVVFQQARTEVFATGKVNRLALRKQLPEYNDFQFAMKWCSFRRAIRSETGYRLKPIPRSGGTYRLDTSEEGMHAAMETDRLKVVKAARNHLGALVDVQRRTDLNDEARGGIAREEIVRSRDVAWVERAYLRSQRRRPAGLEETAPEAPTNSSVK